MPVILAGIAAVLYGALGVAFAFRTKWLKEDPLSYAMGLVLFGTLSVFFAAAALSL